MRLQQSTRISDLTLEEVSRGVFTRVGNDDILSAGVILQEVRDVVHVSVNDHPAIIPGVVLADFFKADEFLATGLLGSR